MIQDILSATIANFTVNNAVAEVAPVATVPPANMFLASAGTRYLAPNDNAVIETLAIRLPYAFISGAAPWQISILGYDSAGSAWNLSGIGVSQSFFVHSENVEINKEVYINFAVNPSGLKTTFISNFRAGAVCCLNAPAILNTVVLPVTVQMKIKHTLPLIA